jgi:hypothetical protein
MRVFICALLLSLLAVGPLPAQKFGGISAGLTLPMGELARIDNAGYAIVGVWQAIPPLATTGFRVDASYSAMTRKATIQGVTEQIANLSAGAVMRFPRISVSYGYAIGTVGSYAQWTSPRPIGSTSSPDLGFSLGAGYRFNVGRRKAFTEARYHKVSSGLRFMPITFGLAF